MGEEYTLESKLKNLKLTKRSLLLEGKDTSSIDIEIELVEDELKNTVSNKKPEK